MVAAPVAAAVAAAAVAAAAAAAAAAAPVMAACQHSPSTRLSPHAVAVAVLLLVGVREANARANLCSLRPRRRQNVRKR